LENKEKLETIADWLEIIQGGDATGEIGVGLPSIEDVLTKDERLNIKIAVLDGWTGLKLYSETATRRQFIGYNENLSAQCGIYIPNYVTSIDAIVGALDRIDADYSVGTYNPLNTSRYRVTATIAKVLRRFQSESMSIALCNLYLAIAPSIPKPKPLIEVLDLGSEVFEVQYRISQSRPHIRKPSTSSEEILMLSDLEITDLCKGVAPSIPKPKSLIEVDFA